MKRRQGIRWGCLRPHVLSAQEPGSIVAGGNVNATIYLVGDAGQEDVRLQDLQALSGRERLKQERASAERQRTAFALHFLPKAMASVRENGGTWDFTGRREALRRVVTWLARPAENRSGLIVSGGPGSGKTAVLGLVASLADPDHHSHVPRQRVGVGKDALPPPSIFTMVIYARRWPRVWREWPGRRSWWADCWPRCSPAARNSPPSVRGGRTNCRVCRGRSWSRT